MIELLKNGSGIHIKKSHKGLFTKYCNGKVTSECIARGKNSPDPKIRKRATFAANARKFKHLQGGILKYLPGGWFRKAVDNISNGFWAFGDATGLYDKLGFDHMFSDLQDFGILPSGGEDGKTYGIVAPGIGGLEGSGLSRAEWNLLKKLFPKATQAFKSTKWGNKDFMNFIEELKGGTPYNFRSLVPGPNGYYVPAVSSTDLGGVTVGRGFVQGNEVTPLLKSPIVEEGLSKRVARPITLDNPVTTREELQAALDYMTETGMLKGKLPANRPPVVVSTKVEKPPVILKEGMSGRLYAAIKNRKAGIKTDSKQSRQAAYRDLKQLIKEDLEIRQASRTTQEEAKHLSDWATGKVGLKRGRKPVKRYRDATQDLLKNRPDSWEANQAGTFLRNYTNAKDPVAKSRWLAKWSLFIDNLKNKGILGME